MGRMTAIAARPLQALDALSDQMHFYVRSLGWVPRTLRRYRREVVRLLAEVGIRDPERVLGCNPHQLSGGMLQRALIAIVFALRPALIIADVRNVDGTVKDEIRLDATQAKGNARTVFVNDKLRKVGIFERCSREAPRPASQREEKDIGAFA